VTRRDYYEVLGVERDASQAALKKAYRRLAMDLHPDRNDDPQATAQFKEATEAYGVLSDPDKRRLYDVGGHDALDGGGFDPSSFSDFGDLFGGVLRDLFNADPRFARRGPRRGEDLLLELPLAFEEACLGVEKELNVPRVGECGECAGSGARAGTGRRPCTDCGGSGQIVLRQGFFAMSRTCGRCRGVGTTLESPCPNCRGEGRVPVEKQIRIKVPAGISEGQRIRVTGEGESGQRGGPPGDLYVEARVAPHEMFWREGFDLHVPLPLSFPQVALGAKVDVPTLQGDAPLEIPAGTEAGDVLRVRGKGVKKLSTSGHGDLLVHVRVRTPRRLNESQRDLLRRYAESVDEHYEVQEERSLLDRVKDIFG